MGMMGMEEGKLRKLLDSSPSHAAVRCSDVKKLLIVEMRGMASNSRRRQL